MSATRSTQTRQAAKAAQQPGKPPVADLQQENKLLHRQLLALRSERDETDELVTFLRQRGNELNARLRVATARVEALQKRVEELEGGDSDAAEPDEA